MSKPHESPRSFTTALLSQAQAVPLRVRIKPDKRASYAGKARFAGADIVDCDELLIVGEDFTFYTLVGIIGGASVLVRHGDVDFAATERQLVVA